MAFELVGRRSTEQRREFDLAVRTLLAQWELDEAAAEHRRRILLQVFAHQLSQREIPDLAWRQPFE